MSARDDYPCMARNVHPDGDLYEDIRRALDEIDKLRAFLTVRNEEQNTPHVYL